MLRKPQIIFFFAVFSFVGLMPQGAHAWTWFWKSDPTEASEKPEPEIEDFVANIDGMIIRQEDLCIGELGRSRSLAPTSSIRPQRRPSFRRTGLPDSFKVDVNPPKNGEPWACDMFIREDGSYGPSGETVRNAILNNTDGVAELISDESVNLPSMRQACYDMAEMSKEERIHVMVWIFASLAWDESKCGQLMTNPKNPEAIGLLQMDRDLEDRKWRGASCSVPSMRPDTSLRDPHEANLQCGMRIMANMFRGDHTEDSTFHLRGLYPFSYWYKLRADFSENFGEGSYVLSRIAEHPGCRQSKLSLAQLSGSSGGVIRTSVRPRPRPDSLVLPAGGPTEDAEVGGETGSEGGVQRSIRPRPRPEGLGI